MFCANCSKLSILYTSRICIRCNGIVLDNISVLCEQCSSSEGLCSACLKKINNQLNKLRYRGCNKCGSK